jgi:hypothetical protein
MKPQKMFPVGSHLSLPNILDAFSKPKEMLKAEYRIFQAIGKK